jgi:cytohesin
VAKRKPTLFEAAANRRTAALKQLIEEGADVHVTDEHGRTPLHYAMTGEAVRVLLAAGADPDARDGEGDTALGDASFWGKPPVVRALLAGGASHSRRIGSCKKTALILAAEGGWSVPVVEALLDAGAKLETKVGSKGTALGWAAEGGKLDVVRCLLDRGAKIDAKRGGNTALALAADMGRAAVVELLLERGADPTGARASCLQEEEVSRLLREVPIRRAETDANVRALLYAAARGEVQALEEALEAGVPPDAKDGAGRTGLALALEGGHRGAAMRLEAALVRGQGLAPAATELLASAAMGDEAGVRSALGDGADPEVRSASGNCALDLACEYLHPEVVRLLLESGASPDRPGDYAPLHWAASSGNHEAVEALLAAGAELDARNDFGETPLLIAVARAEATCARLLLVAGADPDVADGKERTARDLASWEIGRQIDEAERGRLGDAEAGRGGVQRWQDCPICSQLPARMDADVEAGESLPDLANRLERVEFGLWVCPLCRTRYRFERDRGYYVTHWEHDEWLVRLDD